MIVTDAPAVLHPARHLTPSDSGRASNCTFTVDPATSPFGLPCSLTEIDRNVRSRSRSPVATPAAGSIAATGAVVVGDASAGSGSAVAGGAEALVTGGTASAECGVPVTTAAGGSAVVAAVCDEPHAASSTRSATARDLDHHRVSDASMRAECTSRWFYPAAPNACRCDVRELRPQ